MIATVTAHCNGDTAGLPNFRGCWHSAMATEGCRWHGLLWCCCLAAITSAVTFHRDYSIIQVYIGESVTIPCGFSISNVNNSLRFQEIGKVTWYFSQMEEGGMLAEVVVERSGAKETIAKRHLWIGSEKNNCSLVIEDFLEDDVGYYICRINIEKDVIGESKWTKLQVTTRYPYPQHTNAGVFIKLVLIIVLGIYSVMTTVIIIWGYKKMKRAATQEIGSPHTTCKQPSDAPKSTDLYESLVITETPIYNQLNLKEKKVPKDALKPKSKLKQQVDIVMESPYENVNMIKVKRPHLQSKPSK
uniref:uncharacterized protein n=1 Tax=Myxine glutinosa TaxID=7769 RepID=UPI00358F529C